MQANVHPSQTVKHELMLDRIDINQQQTELLRHKLLDAIASARSNMLEDMAQSADYFDGAIKIWQSCPNTILRMPVRITVLL